MRSALMFLLVALAGVGAAVCVAACGSTSTSTTTSVRTYTIPGPVEARHAPPAQDPTTTVAPSIDALGPPVGPVINHAVDPACGTELWAKKTLQDPVAGAVDRVPVDVAGVADLNAIPDTGAQGEGRVGVELHVYRFTGQLVQAKLESDSDYHVVMRDSAGRTLVTEYPAAECVQDAAPAARQEIDAARQAFEKACGPIDASGFRQLSGTATVLGVGFYDRDHGQTGRDSLGDGSDVELHPIIGFKGSCAGGGLGQAHGTD